MLPPSQSSIGLHSLNWLEQNQGHWRCQCKAFSDKSWHWSSVWTNRGMKLDPFHPHGTVSVRILDKFLSDTTLPYYPMEKSHWLEQTVCELGDFSFLQRSSSLSLRLWIKHEVRAGGFGSGGGEGEWLLAPQHTSQECLWFHQYAPAFQWSFWKPNFWQDFWICLVVCSLRYVYVCGWVGVFCYAPLCVVKSLMWNDLKLLC